MRFRLPLLALSLVACSSPENNTPAPLDEARALASVLPASAERLRAKGAFERTGGTATAAFRTRSDFGVHEPHLTLPAMAANPWEVSVGAAGTLATFRLDGAEARPGTLEDGVIRYEEVFPGTDWLVAQGHGGAESFFHLHAATAPTFVAHFGITLRKGARASLIDGSLVIEGSPSEFVTLSSPKIADSKGIVRPGTLALTRIDDDHFDLTMQVNLEGLTAPMLVDPAIGTALFAKLVSPPALFASAAITDTDRGIVYYAGGAQSNIPLSTFASFNGRYWTEVPAGSLPTASAASGAAYDAKRRVLVLVGGIVGTGGSADIFEWDGTQWTKANPAGHAFDSRIAAAVGWDPTSGKVIIHGGVGMVGVSQVTREETLLWDGATLTKVPVTTIPPHAGSQFALDTGRKQLFLFGGEVGGSAVSDVYTWTGTDFRRVELEMGSPVPPPRSNAGWAYDGKNKRLVLANGVSSLLGLVKVAANIPGASYTTFTDVWDLSDADGNGKFLWRKLPVTLPAVGAAQVAYVPSRGTIVISGGMDPTKGVNSRLNHDFRELDGDVLRDLPNALNAPPALMGVAQASAPDGVYLFGGTPDRSQNASNAELRFWDGASFTLLPQAGSAPARTQAAAFVWKGAVYIQGGRDTTGAVQTSTWKFDLATRTWSQGPDGPPFANHAVVVDPVRDVAVTFGGGTAETWEFSGSGWARVSTAAAPSRRDGVALFYDATLARVVVRGGWDGSVAFGDTWSYRTSSPTWELLPDAKGPSILRDSPGATDSKAKLTYSFGGGITTATHDLFAFDGATWLSVPVVNTPPDRLDHVFAFDPAHREAVLHGGRSGYLSAPTVPDTWILRTAVGGCTTNADCPSSLYCTDNVCCESSSCETCSTCAATATGAAGTCKLVPEGGQDGPDCVGSRSCNGAGECGISNGGACTQNAECGSKVCTQGVCCNVVCDTQSCNSCLAEDQAVPAAGTGTCSRKRAGLCGACSTAQDCPIGQICDARTAACIAAPLRMVADAEGGCVIRTTSGGNVALAGGGSFALFMLALRRRRRQTKSLIAETSRRENAS